MAISDSVFPASLLSLANRGSLGVDDQNQPPVTKEYAKLGTKIWTEDMIARRVQTRRHNIENNCNLMRKLFQEEMDHLVEEMSAEEASKHWNKAFDQAYMRLHERLPNGRFAHIYGESSLNISKDTCMNYLRGRIGSSKSYPSLLPNMSEVSSATRSNKNHALPSLEPLRAELEEVSRGSQEILEKIKSLEENGSSQKSDLIKSIKRIEEDQKRTIKMIHSLAQALQDGGKGGLKTALHRNCSWFLLAK